MATNTDHLDHDFDIDIPYLFDDIQHPIGHFCEQFIPVESFFGDYLEAIAAPVQEVGSNNDIRSDLEQKGSEPELAAETESTEQRKNPKRKLATDRAVELNRRAQARYRQKKKARMQELEEIIASREADNTQLRSELALAKLALAQAHKQASILLPALVYAGNPGRHTAEEVVVDRKELALPLEGKFLERIQKLQMLFDKGSESDIARGDALCNEVLDSALFTCLHARQVQGPKLERMLAKAEEWKVLDGGVWGDGDRWRKVAVAVALTPQQKDEFRKLREEVLAELEMIYAERQKLHKTVKSLLDKDRDAVGRDDNVNDEFWKRTTRLATEMESVVKLKGNLEREQRMLRKCTNRVFSSVHMTGIMTKVQSARAVCSSFPEHCDTIALLNAVAELDGGSDVDVGTTAVF